MSSKVTIVVSIIILLLVFAVTGYWLTDNDHNKLWPTDTNPGEDVDTSNWQTYRNEEAGFEFEYPEDWTTRNLKPHRPTRYTMDEEFLVMDPAVHFLSPKDLEIINSPSYTDQPVGFFIEVRKVGDISLTNWVDQYFDDGKPWRDGPVTHLDTEYPTMYDTYSVNVSGLGDGIYSTYIELNNGYLLSISTPVKAYHGGDIFNKIISTLSVNEQ